MNTASAAVVLAVIAALPLQQPAKTVTPGEVLLLSNSSDTASAEESLRQALLNADASVRATAARVIATTGHGALRAALISALAREQDPHAGAEMVHDLLILTGGADLTIVNEQVRRLGGDAAVVFAEWLARVLPEQFAARLGDLTGLAKDHADRLGPIVAMAAAQHPDALERVYRAWMEAAPNGDWDTALSLAFFQGIPSAAVRLFSDALASPRAPIREETVWFVVDSVVKKRDVPADVVMAARPRDDAGAWEAFGRELLLRASSARRDPDRHELIQREGPAHNSDIRRIHGAAFLTSEERAAAQAIVPMPKPTQMNLEWETPPRDAGSTLPAIAPGVIATTFTAAGCDASKGDRIGVAAITYAPSGTPQYITVDPTGLNPECQAALTALARTSVMSWRRPVIDGTAQKVIVPFSRTFAACADEPPPSSGSRAPLRVGARIDQPRKIKDQRPVYPQPAIRGRIQGMVVVEAVMSPSGCISEARVLRSVPYLDLPAVQAVTQWVFEPARVDGVAVPVLMNVTVNFTLQ